MEFAEGSMASRTACIYSLDGRREVIYFAFYRPDFYQGVFLRTDKINFTEIVCNHARRVCNPTRLECNQHIVLYLRGKI